MKRPRKARIAVVLLAAGIGPAQDKKQDKPKQEPTYEETSKWIIGKIAEAGYTRTWKDLQGGAEGQPLVTEYRGSYQNISMGDCRLVYSHVWTLTKQIDTTGSASAYKDELTIPLSKVGPTDIVAKSSAWKDWKVEINAPVGTQKSIKTEPGVAGEEIQINHNVGGEIIFGRAAATDEDSATRLKKAFDHAVELCKTKEEEPF